MSQKPTPLYGETKNTFRLRAIYWIIEQFENLAYDDIVQTYNDQFSPDHTTKESVVRSIRILENRDEIISEPDTDDARRRIWQIV